MTTLSHAALGAIGFIALDSIWLGLVMKNFYREQLAPIARLSDGGLAVNWPAALLVYVLLGLGIGVFVTPRAASGAAAAGFGALFGLVVYGVYDLTNNATLRHWPLALVATDIVWGAAASAVCAVFVWSTGR